MGTIRKLISFLTLGLVASNPGVLSANKIPLPDNQDKSFGHTSKGKGNSKRYKKMTGYSPQAKARRRKKWFMQASVKYLQGGTVSWYTKINSTNKYY